MIGCAIVKVYLSRYSRHRRIVSDAALVIDRSTSSELFASASLIPGVSEEVKDRRNDDMMIIIAI